MLNQQLERKGTGLVGMDKNIAEVQSNLKSDDTKMKLMSSPIKGPHSNLPSNLDTQRIASQMSQITGDILETKSNITAEKVNPVNMKSNPDIRPDLSPIPKDTRSGQASPLTNQNHLSML